VKGKGLENVSSVGNVGYGAEEIITLARKTPDNFIAMCTHGRSGIKRWVLGSVTERVVRHSGDPVLIIRSGIVCHGFCKILCGDPALIIVNFLYSRQL
jgi:nucleotide-binding universal stress UspA family protein